MRFVVDFRISMSNQRPIRPTRPRAAQRKGMASSPSALERAAAFGIDVAQLRLSLNRTVDERLRELDANMAFLADVTGPHPSGSVHGDS